MTSPINNTAEVFGLPIETPNENQWVQFWGVIGRKDAMHYLYNNATRTKQPVPVSGKPGFFEVSIHASQFVGVVFMTHDYEKIWIATGSPHAIKSALAGGVSVSVVEVDTSRMKYKSLGLVKYLTDLDVIDLEGVF